MRKHQIILVGCGSMSNVWLDYVETRDDAGLVDIYESSAQQSLAAKRNLTVPIFTDLQEALDTLAADSVFDVTMTLSQRH